MRLTLVVLCAATLGVACSPTPPEEPPDAGQCIGGVITPDGGCEAKCDPSKCVANNTCVNNRCQLKCTAHSQCRKYAQQCLPAIEDDTGAQIFTCQDTPVQEYGDPCPNGNECSNYCVWTGPGDGRAYCTLDCKQDSDCPGGYECGVVRDPHEVCGSNPKKGNNGFCGTTEEPCISPADTHGAYVETAYCLERKVCLKKDVCASCTSDVDCSWTHTRCVLVGTEKRCAAACAKDSDCERDKICDLGFCVPKIGACTGDGTFCMPCRYDTDCTGKFACVGLHGNEKACIDMSFSTPCTTDEDCPLSPSGRHGACIQDRRSGAYHRCYAPYAPDTNIYSCY